ncbi:MAG: glycosyltransferase family 4 protein [Desulfobacterales bacterium]|nr:glycosyltransferase family 4 protein [Desulfobacterales bacterium]
MTGLLTGIARYLRNLYSAMERINEVELYYFNGNQSTAAMPPSADSDKYQLASQAVRALPDPVVFGMRAARWLWYEHKLNRQCRKTAYNLYHETAFTPSLIRQSVPQVFTLHDLSLIHFRKCHPKERVWFSDFFFHRRIHEASHLIVPSRFIKNDVCDTLSIDESRITVIPEAPDPFFYQRSEQQIKETKRKLSLPDNYLLFVGTLEPRKNIEIIIRALGRMHDKIPLVLTGWNGWGDKPWLEIAARHNMGSFIYQTGYIDEESLARLYSGALTLIYPSLYEGFGLPIIEAMACGCPVICSDAASMPEVAGKAALLIDPADSDDVVRAIETLVYDSQFRTHLVQEGFNQATNFSWDQTAMQTLDLFKAVVK